MISFGLDKGIAEGRVPPGTVSDKIKMTVFVELRVKESFELNKVKI